MSVVKQLYELQEIETEAETLERAIAEITDELKENEPLLKVRTELNRTRERLEVLTKEQRTAEWELDDLTEKIVRVEKELYSGRIGSAKELLNRQLDLENLKGKRSQFETKALELMEQVEMAKTAVTDAETGLKKIEAEQRDREQRLKDELKTLEPLLLAAKRRREELLASIAPDAVERYCRIKGQKGQAIAKIEQGICRGCRISLPAREIQQARSSHLVQCSSCGRLLYMP